MRYLLDTNIISELMKHPAGLVTQHIRRVGEGAVFTSVVVMAEVRYGIEKKQSQRLRRQMEDIYQTLTVLPLVQPTDEHYAAIRVSAERRGRAIGQNDFWIAAHALALEATVVTDDRAFFEMPDLKVENWLRA